MSGERREAGSGEGAVAGFETPRIVDKPWGREVWWAQTEAYLGKFLEVRAGHRLSLQYHRQKLETLHFLSGRGRLTLGDRELAVEAGRSVTIRPGVPHRIAAETDLTVLEVSTAFPDDVVRLEDAYGRAGRP